MRMNRIFIAAVFITINVMVSFGQYDTQEIFNNDRTNAVCLETVGNVITITTNNYPDHSWGD